MPEFALISDCAQSILRETYSKGGLNLEYMGRPDGSTEALKNHLDLGYDTRVDFSSLSHKVIVGRKGSGKSLSIRKFFQHSQRDPSRFAIDITNKPPNLESIVRFSSTMQHRVRTNSWQSIWDFAILVSAVTYILYDEDYQKKFGRNHQKVQLETVEYQYGNCLLGLRAPTQVYEVVNVLVNYFENYEAFARFLFSPIVSNFRSTCTRTLKNAGQICIYLDSLDDEMRRAPAVLTDITRALFYTVIKSARDTDAVPNLHVMITLRDVVFSTIMSSDHADRFLDTGYVLFLFWSPRKSTNFLTEKIKQTQSNLHKNSNKWDTKISSLPELLGFDDVENLGKKVREDVTTYFLRHTNFVPRNTVRFGNRIYSIVDKRGSITEAEFKKSVSDISREISNTLLTAASAYLVAASYDDDIGYLLELDESFREFLAKGPVSERMIDEVVGNMQTNLTDGFIKPIKSFINHIGKDVFSREELIVALDEFTRDNHDYNSMAQNFNLNKLENILWIQGLIGVRQKDGAGDTFYYFSDTNEQTDLPMNSQTFVFFPGLNDVCELEIQEGPPVGPNLRNEEIV